MIAWTGARSGGYAVRVASVSHRGVRAPLTISQPGASAVLSDLVPGPANEVLALWSVTGSGTEPGGGQETIFAARGVEHAPGVPTFDAPEQVAPGGAGQGVSAAYDPDSDRALATWREGGAIRYAIRAPGALGDAAPDVVPAHGPGNGSSAWLGAGIAALALCLLGLCAGVARHRSRLHDPAA